MKYMLDTNICIYAIKHKPYNVFLQLSQVDPDDVCISSITYAELAHGVFRSSAVDKNRLALMLLLSNIEIIDFDADAAEEYGKVRADLELKGEVIGPLDLMIAGHAKSLNCTLVTNNIKEFQRVKGLKTANWTE